MGRNVADALGKLSARPILISAIGSDQTGDYLLKNTLNHIVSTSAISCLYSRVFVRHWSTEVVGVPLTPRELLKVVGSNVSRTVSSVY